MGYFEIMNKSEVDVYCKVVGCECKDVVEV